MTETTISRAYDHSTQPPPVAVGTADENRATVLTAFNAWARGRGSVFDLLSDDVVWTIPGSTSGAGKWHGREAYLAAAVTPLFDRLAKPTRPELIGLWAERDQVILRWRQDTPLKSGGSYCNEYAWFLTMSDRKVIAVTAFLDLAAYASAVGGAA